mmetsp:Transcript_27229/g.69950  ORF Transcript_27229/g.69950 Transcript_27229/m.69950 type:complete len:232 (-) Transcript_27229:736-1431(-)
MLHSGPLHACVNMQAAVVGTPSIHLISKRLDRPGQLPRRPTSTTTLCGLRINIRCRQHRTAQHSLASTHDAIRRASPHSGATALSAVRLCAAYAASFTSSFASGAFFAFHAANLARLSSSVSCLGFTGLRLRSRLSLSRLGLRSLSRLSRSRESRRSRSRSSCLSLSLLLSSRLELLYLPNKCFRRSREMGFRCMKLQYPPRAQVFSSYWRHVASRKSVTGENSAAMGRPL